MNRLSGLFLCRILAAIGMDEDFHYMVNQYRGTPKSLRKYFPNYAKPNHNTEHT
jgi:hypothetical protein